ncbi:MAG: sigma-54-dependent Fis family transcriptional regulator, partial [Phycisphaerales bacterium]|nr:sigma-54-dependent Fis family transcriptional regulator [Phycisphaerales bacterium]
DTLIESELFGHERGAFTGADRQRLGKFELADGGTLFLDEVAELSPAAQAKLLRVLQDGSFERVGGLTQVRCDVRVVAATHRDLAQQVRRGRFREDLFYRLSVFRIDVPALRDRKEDIRALVEHLHVKHALRMGRPISIVNERSLRRLFAYRWPGNVRELENTVERATLLADPDRPGELDIEVPSGGATTTTDAPDRNDPGRSAPPRDVLLDLTHDQLQRLQIMHALESSGYRVYGDNGAAKKLDIKPQTLLSRMDKLGIPRPRVARGTMRRAVREGNNG